MWEGVINLKHMQRQLMLIYALTHPLILNQERKSIKGERNKTWNACHSYLIMVSVLLIIALPILLSINLNHELDHCQTIISKKLSLESAQDHAHRVSKMQISICNYYQMKISHVNLQPWSTDSTHRQMIRS